MNIFSSIKNNLVNPSFSFDLSSLYLKESPELLKKDLNNTDKKHIEIRELIDSLKLIKNELTQEEKQEIKELFSKRS